MISTLMLHNVDAITLLPLKTLETGSIARDIEIRTDDGSRIAITVFSDDERKLEIN